MSPSTLPLLQDFGDRFSPLVVKELRQGLRTRFFTSSLLLFHGFILLLLGSVLLEAPQETVNGVFWGTAGLMLLAVLPLRGFNALNGEAADGTLDMLTLTSISSYRILLGKWVALFSQTLLVAASLLPYMVARYYFGGVEILREAAALVVLVLASGMVTAALLAFSSQRSVVLRLALAAAIGCGVVPLGFFTAFLVAASEADQMLRAYYALQLWERSAIAGGILFVGVYVIWYFLALGASRIAPPSENHSTRKRLIVLGVHAFLAAVGLLLACRGSGGEEGMWAFFPLSVLTFMACMDMMTEEMPRFPMAVAELARRGASGTAAGRLLHPGWASGVLFSALLCVITLLLLGVICVRVPVWADADGPFLFFCCLFSGAFVPVIVNLNRNNVFANWWVVQICMLALGILLAMVCGATGMRDAAAIGFVTPVTTLFGAEWVPHSMRDSVIVTGAAISLLWVLGAVVRAVTNFAIYNTLENEVRLLRDSTHRKEPRS